MQVEDIDWFFNSARSPDAADAATGEIMMRQQHKKGSSTVMSNNHHGAKAEEDIEGENDFSSSRERTKNNNKKKEAVKGILKHRPRFSLTTKSGQEQEQEMETSGTASSLMRVNRFMLKQMVAGRNPPLSHQGVSFSPSLSSVSTAPPTPGELFGTPETPKILQQQMQSSSEKEKDYQQIESPTDMELVSSEDEDENDLVPPAPPLHSIPSPTSEEETEVDKDTNPLLTQDSHDSHETLESVDSDDFNLSYSTTVDLPMELDGSETSSPADDFKSTKKGDDHDEVKALSNRAKENNSVGTGSAATADADKKYLYSTKSPSTANSEEDGIAVGKKSAIGNQADESSDIINTENNNAGDEKKKLDAPEIILGEKKERVFPQEKEPPGAKLGDSIEMDTTPDSEREMESPSTKEPNNTPFSVQNKSQSVSHSNDKDELIGSICKRLLNSSAKGSEEMHDSAPDKDNITPSEFPTEDDGYVLNENHYNSPLASPPANVEGGDVLNENAQSSPTKEIRALNDVDSDNENPGFNVVHDPATPQSIREDHAYQERQKINSRSKKSSSKKKNSKRGYEGNGEDTETDGEVVTPSKRSTKDSKKKSKKRNKKITYHSPKGIQIGSREYNLIELSSLKQPPTDESPSLRRSRRTRCKPLDYWKNERLVYGANNRRYGLAMGNMPIVKSIVKAQPTPYKKRKVKKVTPSSSNRRKNNNNEKVQAALGDDKETQPYDSRKLRKKYELFDGEVATIWDDGTETPTEQKVISYSKNLTEHELPPTAKRRKSEGRVLGKAAQSFNIPNDENVDDYVGYIMGHLVLPPRGIKDAESVGSCAQTFTVCSCQSGGLEISFADPTQNEGEWIADTAQRFLLGSGDQFRVPPGNCYRLENHSKSMDCVLSWTIIRSRQSTENQSST